MAWSARSPSSCGAKVVDRLGAPLAEPIFEHLAIIGVGLIGSSIARAARHAMRPAHLSPRPIARDLGARQGLGAWRCRHR